MISSITTFVVVYMLRVMFCFYFIQVFRNDAADKQFNLEAAIKNVDKMSDELKKLNGNSEFII